MSINREQRRKVADNLAALMRGEITYGDYLQRGAAIKKQIEQSDDPDKFAAYNASVEWLPPAIRNEKLHANGPFWNEMRCRLAFLESDLEMKRVGHRKAAFPKPSSAILVFILGAILLAIMVWTATNTLIFFVIWGVVGAVGGVAILILADRQQKSEANEPSDRFHPFNDETQFRAHINLLELHNLPSETEEKANQPLSEPAKKPEPFLIKLGGSMMILLMIPLTITFFLSWMVISGPFVVLLYLFPNRKNVYVATSADSGN